MGPNAAQRRLEICQCSSLRLTRRERRLAFAKRLYAGELPDAALLAFAEWNG
jgi:hypothetical protein